MPGFESRMGWNDEIDSFARVFMAQMSSAVNDWAKNIITRKGVIIDRVNDRIREKEETIRLKETMLQQAEREVANLQTEAMKAKKQWQRLIDEAGRCKTVANKYLVERDNLGRLPENSRAWHLQLARLKQFEPKYRQWCAVMKTAEEKLEKYQSLTKQAEIADRKRRNMSLFGMKINRFALSNEKKFELGQLYKDKELLEDAVARNMEKHCAELAEAFLDRRYVSAVAGMIANTIDRSLNSSLRFNEFSENEIFQFLEEIFNTVSTDKMEKFNFLKVLAETRKYYSIRSSGGRQLKVFDMDHINTDDMMRVFSGWLRYSIGNATINVLEKMKKKRTLFIPEQQRNRNDDESSSLYDVEQADNPGGFRVKDETVIRNQAAQEYWTGLEAYLHRNLDAIAGMANRALQKQLPESSYLRRIGENGAMTELRTALEKIITATGSELRNGNVAFSKLKNFTKSAFGGAENNETFHTIHTVIRAALEYFVVSKMGRNILNEVKNLKREEAAREIALLQALARRKVMSEQTLGKQH